MGKSRQPGEDRAHEHLSRPLTTLKDPGSFGPPPKNVNYHGGAALPNDITPHTSGLGAPLTQEQISDANRAVREPSVEEDREEQKHAGPPLPYRADRTGLRTDHLPPPPVHRDMEHSQSTVAATAPAKPRPGLPPRLPSRHDVSSTPVPALPAQAQPPPPAYESVATQEPSWPAASTGGLNQTAISRLGNAGVSVPALGIGASESNAWRSEPGNMQQRTTPSPRPQPPPTAANQISELQSRFSRMNSNAGPPTSTSPFQPATAPTPPAGVPAPTPPMGASPPLQGTTWAENQAALQTASNLHKDPSNVSLGEARSATTTMASFRERHQDTIAAASNKAKALDKKYNVSGRINSFLEKHSSPSPTSETAPPIPGQHPIAPTQPQSPDVAASLSRKPPPPPPPKKPVGMHGSALIHNGPPAPPPVPLGTKPSYS